MITDESPFYTRLPCGAAFLGARAQRFAELISKQGDDFFRAAGIDVPVRTVSTVLYLRHEGPSSLVQIARALSEPHQVTAKRMATLESLSMVSCKADADDKRRRLFRLTRKGKRESTLIEARCEDAMQIFEKLNLELELNVGAALDAAYDALARRSMLARSNDNSADER